MKLFAFKAASHCEITRFKSGQAHTLNFRTCAFSVDELLQNIREPYSRMFLHGPGTAMQCQIQATDAKFLCN